MAKSGYGAKDIHVLDAISHIQLNPNMYISTTENSSHLVEEALDNALDEAQAGYANIVAVVGNTDENEYAVLDNGRGIPLDNDTPITVSTQLFSGAKFSDRKEAYKISCFIGSTKVRIEKNGQSIDVNIQDLEGKGFNGFGFDLESGIESTSMTASKTGYTRFFVRIGLSNGNVEICTPDHLWLDETYEYICARDLIPGTNLKSFLEKNETVYVISNETYVASSPIPVYDIYNWRDSNFVLSSGPIVHNSGLHGVGLVAIYALSDKYGVEIYRDGKHGIFQFKDCKLENKKVGKSTLPKNQIPFSTKISFSPSSKYFTETKPDFERIRARMNFASVEMPHLTLALIVNNQREVIKCDLEQFFENEVKTSTDTDSTPRIDLSVEKDVEKFKVSFCYSFSGAITNRFITSVNLLPIKQNGTHANYFQEVLRNYFINKAKRTEYNFLPGDVLVGLRCYFSLSLANPKFKGQSKERLENSKEQLREFLVGIEKKLDEYFSSNPELLENILEHFHNYRKTVESKKVKSTGNRKGSNKYTKLRDCKSRAGELFVVEGDSAAGGIIQTRDPNKIAILPLRGKIPSVVNKKDILNNVEIGELFQALGTGVEPDFNIDNMRYEKLICCCDADPDGGHIAVLLTMAIAILAPEIIKQGRYYIANTPLYGTRKKKEFIPLWTEKDVRNEINKGSNIIRFKGLGEFNPKDLYECLLNESKRNLTQICWGDDVLDDLIKLLRNADEKRSLVEDIETVYFEAYERIDNFIKHNYRKYGNHVNMERMIPLATDGLRPVERRVLYSAYEMAREKFAKSATIVGHTLRYHPHGDSSVYGSLTQLVGHKFMDGQGNFGSNIGVERIGPAAMRYTEARLGRGILDAFKLMDFANMIEGEIKGFFEPEYIPCQFPFCLYAQSFITGIGFGVKTTVPSYDIVDLWKRLLWLLGERKTEPVIYPRNFGCIVEKNDNSVREILTTGKGILVYKGVIEVNKTKDKAILRSMPPSVSFSKIEKAILGKEFSYMDQSTGDAGTQIEFMVDRKRNHDALFKQMVSILQKTVTGQMIFFNYQIDREQADRYQLRVMGVDEMLLDAFTMYSTHYEEYINSLIEKIESDLKTLTILEKIRSHIKPYLGIESEKFNDVEIAKELSKIIKEEEGDILEILRKFTLSRIFRMKIDKEKLDENLKNLNIIKRDMRSKVIEIYNEFVK